MRHSIIKSNTSKIVGVLAWLLIWQVVALLKDNIYIVPSPYVTLKALISLLDHPKFIKSIVSTLIRVFVGFSLSTVLGIVLGVLSGLNKWVRDFLKPFISVIKATPVISVILMIIIWVDSEYTAIVVAFLMCFPIVWTNTYEGIIQTDRKLLEMSKCFQISKKDIVRHVYMPSVRPYIISAISASIGIAWKVTVAAEVLSFPRFSIGSRLFESKIYAETPEVFAWTVVVVVLSLIFENVIKYYLKKIEKLGGYYD